MTTFQSEAAKGIARAAEHADREFESWTEEAFDILSRYIKAMRGAPFTAPMVRDFAERNGLEAPPSKRAWGQPFVRAKRLNMIACTGFVNASNEMHSQPIRVWRERGRSQDAVAV